MIIIKNVLSKEERIQLIEDSKSLLIAGEELSLRFKKYFSVSKQTLSNLHKNGKFQPIIRKLLDRIAVEMGPGLEPVTDNVWVNWNSGKKEEMMWHSHSAYDYACVYYMQTIPFLNSGTQFVEEFIRAPQNSLMIFPGDEVHSVPSYPFGFERYTLSMDLNIVRCMG